jgi:hypothetical protein
MAAVEINSSDDRKRLRFLESIAYTNTQTDVQKAIKVPGDVRFATFFLYHESAGGTTPSVTTTILIPDFSTVAKFSAPTDDNMALLADFAGTTAVTGTGAYLQTIDIGPGVTGIADDATGAAAADARMAVNALLPPWLVYKLDFGADADEDYALKLLVQFRP